MILARSLAIAALMAAITVPAAASDERLDASLRDKLKGGCSGTQSVIVRARPGERDKMRKSLASQGRKVKGEFPALNSIVTDVRCDDLTTLVRSGNAVSVSENAVVGGHQWTDGMSATSSTTTFTWTSTGTTLVRLTEALSAQQLQGNFFSTLGVRQSLVNTWSQYTWSQYTMPQVGVAVIDSGIEPGIDFGSRITAFYDFTYGDIRVSPPSDEYGHGTHVAGLAAGTYTGVAPAARLIGLKVLNAQGRGTTDNVIRAIEFAIVNKSLLGIDVINLSLGHPVFESAATDPLVQAVEHAVRSGIIVVVSAGNFGRNSATGQTLYGTVASPGNAPSAISVGSLKTFNTVSRGDDRIAAYSSRGPSRFDRFVKPDISAPGDNLLSVAATGSALRLAQERRGNVGNYMRLSGTSMAAAVVSGAIALIRQANQNLTPNSVKMVLQYSSLNVKNDDGTDADVMTRGAGALNGSGALSLARAINGRLALGEKWLLTTVAPRTTIGGEVYTWAQWMIWGNHIASGTGVIDEQRLAWALNIVWGDGFSDDDNIVWGNLDDDNIVWGNLFDDDDNIVWGNAFNDDDNIVWGNLDDDNIVWGNLFTDDDNIVWGNSALLGEIYEESDATEGVN